jgi:2-oxoglutarate dehydrogenase E1 component
MPPSNDEFDAPGDLSLEYVERLWEIFQRTPDQVDRRWRNRFESLHDVKQLPAVSSRVEVPSDGDGSLVQRAFRSAAVSDGNTSQRRRRASDLGRQQAATRLIDAYRSWGHRAARLDPLGRTRRDVAELNPEAHGLGDADLDDTFHAGGLPGAVYQPLGDIVRTLRQVYCGTIGVEYAHIPDADVRLWVQQLVEHRRDGRHSARTRKRMLRMLSAATEFEGFMQKHFVGAKTFSLSGSESLVALVDLVVERSAQSGMREIVLAMAHRGRLNVLANVIGKPPRRIFYEFRDENASDRRGSGDVRYHLGFSGDRKLSDGESIHLSLCFNPSHLEFVNPVALGRLKAKQQRAGDDGGASMAVLLHGDASFAAEGVVQETLNLAPLAGYATGGALHVVVNNQLGFTTPPGEGRATEYATDVARMLGAAIFHVNGDDVDAVAHVAEMASEFRRRFRRDAVIDLWCYRRLGHNEIDEPAFTQPAMYDLIEKTKPVRDAYAKQLVREGVLATEDARQIHSDAKQRLDREFDSLGEPLKDGASEPAGLWSGYLGGYEPQGDTCDTRVPSERLKELLSRLIAAPDGFHLHRKLEQGLARRQEMIHGERPLDWSTCEALAMASLAVQGHPVRLAGQDTARGTFSQRHAVWHDQQNGRPYMPLAHLDDEQARVDVINSPLCETAALGFEYGFSLDYPEALVAWEAQFGDFWNAAQVIFDQFIASAHDKWSRLSGLVMLLPHGFEGQGPEHSSARLERFLTSTAEDNIQVVAPSTPAQFFHCLRRQVLRRWRAPLIVLTPKSLLRHHAATSTWEDVAEGRFRRVIADDDLTERCGRVMACSGKLFYELEKARIDAGRDDVGILRVEQLYPFPERDIREALEQLPAPSSVYWVQEEPENMGAANYMLARWAATMPNDFPLIRIARPASASPATGSHGAHKIEQRELIERALGLRASSDDATRK